MDKNKIARYHEVESDAVLKWRLVDEGATVRALIDYGIGGIKVYETPIANFAVKEQPKPKPKPKPEPKPEPEVLPVPAAVDLSLDDLSYREIQALARAADIPANQSKAKLKAALAKED